MILMALPVNQVMPSRKNSSRDSIGDIALVAGCLACTCVYKKLRKKNRSLKTERVNSMFNGAQHINSALILMAALIAFSPELNGALQCAQEAINNLTNNLTQLNYSRERLEIVSQRNFVLSCWMRFCFRFCILQILCRMINGPDTKCFVPLPAELN